MRPHFPGARLPPAAMTDPGQVTVLAIDVTV
jgi:hypothetical protein